MKSTYDVDANRKVIARHKGAHSADWGIEMSRHYDEAISKNEFPFFEAPCTVIDVDPDPFADSNETAVGVALPS